MKHSPLYKSLVDRGCDFYGGPPFTVTGLDKSLLPAVFPPNLKKIAIYYDCSASEIFDSLLFFVRDKGVVFDPSFLKKDSVLEGFEGSVSSERGVFFEALRCGFKNHQCVFFPKSLVGSPLFNQEVLIEGFVVDGSVSYSCLVDRLGLLGYVAVDFVEGR